MPSVTVRSFPISAKVAKQGAQQILAADRARINKFRQLRNPHGPNRNAKSLKAQKPFSVAAAANGETNVDVTDAAVTYTMQVGVGEPPEEYTLLYVSTIIHLGF